MRARRLHASALVDGRDVECSSKRGATGTLSPALPLPFLHLSSQEPRVAGVALSLVLFSPHRKQNSAYSSKTATTTERVARAQRCKVRVTVVPRAVIATPSSTGLQNGCAKYNHMRVTVLLCQATARTTSQTSRRSPTWVGSRDQQFTQ